MKGFFTLLTTYKKQLLYTYLGFIILFNLISKCYYLSEESLYMDEAYSVYYSQQSVTELFYTISIDQNPPLYYLLLHYWMEIFGNSEFAFKSLSVLVSTAAVVVLFLFSNRFLNTTTAIFSTLLYSFSFEYMYFSHEARCYSLILLLTISSAYFYFSLIQRPNGITMLFLALANTLLLYTHYLTLFVPLIELSCCFFYLKNKAFIKFFFLSGILSLVLFLPYFKYGIENIPKAGTSWLQHPSFENLKNVFIRLAGGKFLFIIYYPLLFLISIFFLFRKKLAKENLKLLFFFLCLWAVPIIGDYVVSQYNPVFVYRYVLYSSLGTILCITYLITTSFKTKGLQYLFFAPVFFQYQSSFTLKPEKAEPWNLLMPEVIEEKTPGSCIIVTPSFKFKAFSYYYNQDYFKDYTNTLKHLNADTVFFINSMHKELLYKLNSFSKIIVVDCGKKEDLIDKNIQAMGFQLEKEKFQSDIHIMVYHQNPLAQQLFLEKIELLKNKIQQDSDWMNAIKLKAENQQIPVDCMLTIDATYLVKKRIQDSITNMYFQERIAFFKNKIQKDNGWLTSIKQKAESRHISLDSMLTIDATYLAEKEK